MLDNEMLLAMSEMLDKKLGPINEHLNDIDMRLEHLNDIDMRLEHLNDIDMRLEHLNDIDMRLEHLNDIDMRLEHLNDIDMRLEHLNDIDMRLDSVESQIKQTERVLKNEIRNSENLILDEVERVHRILDKHKNDNSKHIA